MFSRTATRVNSAQRRLGEQTQVVALRLDPKAAEALRTLARRKGTNYSTLARSWISERLRDELNTKAKAGRRRPG